MLPAWTLYTFGNGRFVAALLTGVSALVHSGPFTQLLLLLFISGLGGWLLIQVPSGQLDWPGLLKYVLFTALFLRFVMGFDVNVGLVDVCSGGGSQVVGRVPFFLGVPACLLSQMGYKLASQFDQAYSDYTGLPRDLTLSSLGGGVPSSGKATPVPLFNPIARLLEDAMASRIVDLALARSLTYFFVDCVAPLVAQHRMTAQALLHSHDIWSYIGQWPQHPGLMTLYFAGKAAGVDRAAVPAGQVLSCPAVHEKLTAILKQHRLAAERVGIDRALSHSASATLFQSVLNYTAQDQLHTRSAGAFLQQAALVRLLSHRVVPLMAVRTHSDLLFKQLGLLRQEKEIASRWVAASHAFSAVFGYVFAGLQVMVYAMAPFMLLFAVLPGLRGQVLRRYMQLLIWFPVTFVLISIVSNVCASWVAQSLQPVWGVSGGLSLANRGFMTTKLQHFIEIGGWLVTMVPLFSWGLVTGGQSAVSTLLRTAISANTVSRAALDTTTGNVSLDQQRYRNTQANHFASDLHTQLGAAPVNLHRQSSAMLERAHLGGVYVTQNHQSAMDEVKTWREQRHAQVAGNMAHQGEQAKSQQQSILSHQTEVASQAARSYATTLQSQVDAGALGAGVSFAVQRYLAAHIPDRPLTVKQRDDVEHMLQHATHSSALSAQAQAEGEQADAQRMLTRSAGYFQRAYHAIRGHFPAGERGEWATIGVLGAGIAGVGAGLAVTAPEAGGMAVATALGASTASALSHWAAQAGEGITAGALEKGLALAAATESGQAGGGVSAPHPSRGGVLRSVLGHLSGQGGTEFARKQTHHHRESYWGQAQRQASREAYLQSERTQGTQGSDAIVRTSEEKGKSVPGQAYYAAQAPGFREAAPLSPLSMEQADNHQITATQAFWGDMASWEYRTQAWMHAQGAHLARPAQQQEEESAQ